MFYTGLVSVSFRPLSPFEIVTLCKDAGLSMIEWGGDIHVPDEKAAVAVRAMTHKEGLYPCAYGSYYKVGTYGGDYQKAFQPIVDTAYALGVPVIRVWAHDKGSADVSDKEFARIKQETGKIANMAQQKGIAVAFECHINTLTDHYQSALRLIDCIENAGMFWQPNQYQSIAYNIEAADALAPFVHNIHVFQWKEKQKFPLAQGAEEWQTYLSVFQKQDKDYNCMLEFMPDNEPASLKTEAETLRKLVTL